MAAKKMSEWKFLINLIVTRRLSHEREVCEILFSTIFPPFFIYLIFYARVNRDNPTLF